MGKAIRIHLARDGKSTYCGLIQNNSIAIAKEGENFFEVGSKPIEFNCMCKNCISLYVKNPIYRNFVELVKYNESILQYEKQLPKTRRAMQLYCAKRRIKWNSKNGKPNYNKLNSPVAKEKEQVIELTDVVIEQDQKTEARLNSIEEKAFTEMAIANGIELEPNGIARSQKGIKRELRKLGKMSINQVNPNDPIYRIKDTEFPIAMVRGFGNNWKVIEEFSSINNCNSSNCKELSGWVDIQLARKIYNQAIMNRHF